MLTRDSGSCSVGATHHVMKAPYLLAARRIQLGASDLGGIAVARKTFRLLAAFPAARSNWARRSSVVIGRGGALAGDLSGQRHPARRDPCARIAVRLRHPWSTGGVIATCANYIRSAARAGKVVTDRRRCGSPSGSSRGGRALYCGQHRRTREPDETVSVVKSTGWLRSPCTAAPHFLQREPQRTQGVVQPGLHGAFGDVEVGGDLRGRPALVVRPFDHRPVIGG